MCSGSLAGGSSGACAYGAALLRPATVGGVATGTECGALKVSVSPPDTGAEGRGVVVRMSSGSFSDHGRSGVVTLGVGACARAGGEAKGSMCRVVTRQRTSGLRDGVAPVKMDVGSCLDIRRKGPSSCCEAGANVHSRLCHSESQSAGILDGQGRGADVACLRFAAAAGLFGCRSTELTDGTLD